MKSKPIVRSLKTISIFHLISVLFFLILLNCSEKDKNPVAPNKNPYDGQWKATSISKISPWVHAASTIRFTIEESAIIGVYISYLHLHNGYHFHEKTITLPKIKISGNKLSVNRDYGIYMSITFEEDNKMSGRVEYTHWEVGSTIYGGAIKGSKY